MSRFTKIKKLKIAFGFDPMTPTGGYFFQVFEEYKDDDEEILVNEGFDKGISKTKMLELMEAYNVGTTEQRQLVAMDLPI